MGHFSFAFCLSHRAPAAVARSFSLFQITVTLGELEQRPNRSRVAYARSRAVRIRAARSSAGPGARRAIRTEKEKTRVPSLPWRGVTARRGLAVVCGLAMLRTPVHISVNWHFVPRMHTMSPLSCPLHLTWDQVKKGVSRATEAKHGRKAVQACLKQESCPRVCE